MLINLALHVEELELKRGALSGATNKYLKCLVLNKSVLLK